MQNVEAARHHQPRKNARGRPSQESNKCRMRTTADMQGQDACSTARCITRHLTKGGKLNKRQKLAFDVKHALNETAEVLGRAPFKPLLQTPPALFRSMCASFEAEYPGLLAQADIENIVRQMQIVQQIN